MNGIRSALPSGRSTSQCKLPLVAFLRDAARKLGVDARLKVWASVCPGSGVTVPKPQNAQAAVTDQGWAGTYRSHIANPSTPQALAPGSNSCFGQVVRVAGRAPANRQPGRCKTMCHPFELARAAMHLAPQKRARNAFLLLGSCRIYEQEQSKLRDREGLSLLLPKPGRIEQHWLHLPGGLDSA